MIRAAEKNTKPAQRRLDFIALALRGKKVGMEKVIKMCDDMAVLLKKEQGDDDNKKEYCEKQIGIADDKRKVLEQSISDSEKALEDAAETIATAADEIKALESGIKKLDESVDEATEQRQKENAEFKALMVNDGAAKELIGIARNRMNKFYNPSQYVAPPKRELSREDRIAVNMGGTAPPTPAPGGIAGTGIMAFVQVHSQSESQKAQQESA